MIDNIARAQISAGVEVCIAVAVSLFFLIPTMYSAPLLPIGVSLLAVAGLLACSTIRLRVGLRFWIFPVSLAVGLLLLLVLLWSIYDSQTVVVPTWTTTIAIVGLCLVGSVIVVLLSVFAKGRGRLGASLATITLGTTTVLCLAIVPLSAEPVEAVFWVPALLATVCLVITAAELVLSRRAVQG